jgi:hypothetical protein
LNHELSSSRMIAQTETSSFEDGRIGHDLRNCITAA